MKDIKEELNAELVYVHGQKTQYCQYVHCSQFIYGFNSAPIEIPASNFVDIDTLILKFIWKGRRPRIAKTMLKEKNRVKGLMLLDFRTYCKAIVIKALLLLAKE